MHEIKDCTPKDYHNRLVIISKGEFYEVRYKIFHNFCYWAEIQVSKIEMS